jgi:pimeloyl-ACP methyl ester carboxylesterase
MSASSIAVHPAQPIRSRWGRRIGILAVGLAVLLVIAYFGVCVYAVDRMTRPVRQTVVQSPAQYGLVYENVEFDTAVDHIRLRGWLLDSPGDQAILMLHGRNQTRDRDEAALQKAATFVGQGYDVLMFDFRAHGLSDGERYAMGAWETRDITGALDYLKGRGYTEFGTYGVSMGAAISLLAAPEHPEIKALVVDSPFADLKALLETRLTQESGLPAFFNPGLYLTGRVVYGIDVPGVRPVDALAQLGDRPIFHVQSQAGDEWVPLSEGYALQKAGAADPNYTFWAAPGKGHVRAYTNNTQEYTQRMLAFYARYLR